jgi:hypothetical protein
MIREVKINGGKKMEKSSRFKMNQNLILNARCLCLNANRCVVVSILDSAQKNGVQESTGVG